MAPVMIGENGDAVFTEPVRQWLVSVAVFGHAMADNENGGRCRRGIDCSGYRVAITNVQRQGLFVHRRGPLPCCFPLWPGVATPAVSIGG